jgi:hypothetical protein
MKKLTLTLALLLSMTSFAHAYEINKEILINTVHYGELTCLNF